MELSKSDPVVMEARRSLMQSGPIPAILAAQQPDDWWGKPGSSYSPKYTSTVWQIIFLVELGADPQDIQVQKSCRYLLEHSLSAEGIFSAITRLLPTGAVYCLNGNLLFALQ